MFTFLIYLDCPKAYHRPDHTIRIVEYHRKKYITPAPNIFTGTRTQGSFRVCKLCSSIPPTETNKIVFGSVLLSCLVTELQKTFSPGLEPSIDFRDYSLCSVISLNEQLWSWRRSSLLLNFRAKETTHTGTRTEDKFGVMTFLKFLPGFKVQACQFWCKLFVRSRAISDHTYTYPQCIPMMMVFALYRILCRRRDDRRCDTRRRVTSVEPHGVSWVGLGKERLFWVRSV
jgi:hypothetical protein